MTNLVFRTVLFALSWTEVCRLIAIPICLVLWTINVARREMFMWGNMARRSNLGGHFYYRQIAILYTLRRRPTTFVLSFIVITGFIYEVNLIFNIGRTHVNLWIYPKLCELTKLLRFFLVEKPYTFLASLPSNRGCF